MHDGVRLAQARSPVPWRHRQGERACAWPNWTEEAGAYAWLGWLGVGRANLSWFPARKTLISRNWFPTLNASRHGVHKRRNQHGQKRNLDQRHERLEILCTPRSARRTHLWPIFQGPRRAQRCARARRTRRGSPAGWREARRAGTTKCQPSWAPWTLALPEGGRTERVMSLGSEGAIERTPGWRAGEGHSYLSGRPFPAVGRGRARPPSPLSALTPEKST